MGSQPSFEVRSLRLLPDSFDEGPLGQIWETTFEKLFGIVVAAFISDIEHDFSEVLCHQLTEEVFWLRGVFKFIIGTHLLKELLVPTWFIDGT